MRYRATILFLLAILLAAYPALDNSRRVSMCGDSYRTGDSNGILSLGSNDTVRCTSAYRENGVPRMLLVLAAVCAVGGFASAVKSWRDRQQDRALLKGARLPMWGRGVPYR